VQQLARYIATVARGVVHPGPRVTRSRTSSPAARANSRLISSTDHVTILCCNFRSGHRELFFVRFGFAARVLPVLTVRPSILNSALTSVSLCCSFCSCVRREYRSSRAACFDLRWFSWSPVRSVFRFAFQRSDLRFSLRSPGSQCACRCPRSSWPCPRSGLCSAPSCLPCLGSMCFTSQ
jgi:hypothetical protein